MFMVPSLADYKPLQIPYFYQNVNPAKHKVTQASSCTIDHELHYSYPGSQFALLPEAKKLQYFYNVTSQRLHRLNAHFFFYIRMICTGKKIGKFGILRQGPTRTCYLLVKDLSQSCWVY